MVFKKFWLPFQFQKKPFCFVRRFSYTSWWLCWEGSKERPRNRRSRMNRRFPTDSSTDRRPNFGSETSQNFGRRSQRRNWRKESTSREQSFHFSCWTTTKEKSRAKKSRRRQLSDDKITVQDFHRNELFWSNCNKFGRFLENVLVTVLQCCV